MALARNRLSFGSVDLQTAQSQPITGTPWLVPEPKMVIFIALILVKTVLTVKTLYLA